MKKSLVALAVLAASGAAMAQSSVTLSGTVNLGLVKTTGSSAQLNAANGASQIVFSGTEDLGGGLKAIFRLAQRFSPESGNNDGTLNQRPTFQGESTVGLAGSLGTIRLGRALTALQGPVNSSDPWGTLTVGSTANLTSGYATDPRQADGAGLGRTDAIFYSSPNFSGFTAAVSVGPKNSAAVVPATTGTKNMTSLWLQYANGPIMVGGGAEHNRVNDKVTALLGTYDFGVVKLGAGISRVDTVAIAGSNAKHANVMASAPFGAFTAKVGYARSKAEGTGNRTKKLGLGGEYALSKRTYLYTTYGNSKTGSAASVKGIDVGMSHSF